MPAEYIEILLADGPLNGQYVMVPPGPGGGPPPCVELPNPFIPGSRITYWLVQVAQGPDKPPTYQSTVPKPDQPK